MRVGVDESEHIRSFAESPHDVTDFPGNAFEVRAQLRREQTPAVCGVDFTVEQRVTEECLTVPSNSNEAVGRLPHIAVDVQLRQRLADPTEMNRPRGLGAVPTTHPAQQ